jgi:quercetin dioxygenase-like cupin family protein
MNDDAEDVIEFDEAVAVALALTADRGERPGEQVKGLLMARLGVSGATQTVPPLPETPEGFTFRFGHEDDWLPHPVPGIRMKVLGLNRAQNYATLLLDVAPGTRFPAHHHDGDEECYVISGSVMTMGRRLGPGDFLHADAGTDHGELYTETGAQVILVVTPEDYMPAQR